MSLLLGKRNIIWVILLAATRETKPQNLKETSWTESLFVVLREPEEQYLSTPDVFLDLALYSGQSRSKSYMLFFNEPTVSDDDTHAA